MAIFGRPGVISNRIPGEIPRDHMSRKLIIVGGGIGGMSAALALHRAGIAFELCERARDFAEAGAGMSLWPNATRVLGSWGVLDRVVALGAPVQEFHLRRRDGSIISALSMRGFPTPALCIHRADLHRSLHGALPPACLAAGMPLQSFAQDAAGVTARFAGGREIAGAGLVGADGIHSAVRAQLHGAAAPIYRGYCIWRGIAPEVPGIVRGQISETWGHGHRFGILPMGQGRICWYATRNGPSAQPDAPEARKPEVSGLFQNWHDPIPALIAATDPADIMRNDARDRHPLPHWGDRRVTLLGDAAHPITPNVGQGACMAIEDAACLARCLRAIPDVAAAFRRYEGMRRPRTALVGRRARRIGMIGQWEDRWLVALRNVAARLVLAHSADMRRNDVYAYDIESQRV
jgi:2-polyprenyl-6-methoxyphenol hydroxylase-like FAD-dependent oxidoreductase